MKGANPELMTLRSLAVAQKFPQELPDGAAHKARGEAHVCADDGSALVPILITTYGELGDPAVWREYPLAVDGWRCPKDGNIEFPRSSAPRRSPIYSSSARRPRRAGTSTRPSSTSGA